MDVYDRGLAHYLQQAAQHPLLTEEQEAEADRDTLVTHNLRLAVHIARQYAYNVDDLLDYIQEANIGLMQAADTFDPGKARFSTWAVMYVRGAIRNRQRDCLGNRVRRRIHGEPPTTCDVEVLTEMPSQDDPERDVARQKELEYAARRLTTKQLHVMTQRLLGETFQEIADAQDTTHQAIQSLQRSAMRTLRHAE